MMGIGCCLRMRGVRAISLLLLALAIAPPAPAGAAQSVRLDAALRPENLGQGTTIEFGFTVITHNGQPPSPLTGIDLYYPANLGLATSGLGLETCTAATL